MSHRHAATEQEMWGGDLLTGLNFWGGADGARLTSVARNVLLSGFIDTIHVPGTHE